MKFIWNAFPKFKNQWNNFKWKKKKECFNKQINLENYQLNLLSSEIEFNISSLNSELINRLFQEEMVLYQSISRRMGISSFEKNHLEYSDLKIEFQ